ncbi:macro domain-containing protein [Allofranklinella schreckenbergeri]|uniref:hypothetical protein n=1 Tax=Allofranklinella schreckenbergeri TaxID=1076744 RepID=UPI001EEE6E57|nr:hypothetical protein [Allofranklinella schreckenbergeri]
MSPAIQSHASVYDYPPELAAPVAAVQSHPDLARLEQVLFCCFGPADWALYQSLLGAP